ncbi:hypothetical protein VA7868_02510 [Vibrio aerogenes CECT 7868]|uniref:Uncharacterized protein n=1 Tax=Vibrio aerogenes CECT 7868 TaxID=1216006 RepID=A0A1M5ZB11_9VIBR|nr:hypothetical protein [Vibrio aerogenes]SHI21372.1 hypothetical protein VA7868_02510 [Vibrio aerogenes CECT 7868]
MNKSCCSVLYIAFGFLTFLLPTGGYAQQNIADNIYHHYIEQNRPTGFIILSNLELSEALLKEIEMDYQQTTDKTSQYYYEYLLAKRTQESRYINRFIQHSNTNISELVQNNSLWVSVTNPFYALLSVYAMTDAEALKVLFKLSQLLDGSALSGLYENLSEIQMTNPDLFNRVRKTHQLPLDYWRYFKDLTESTKNADTNQIYKK